MQWTKFMVQMPVAINNCRTLAEYFAHDTKFVYAVIEAGGGISHALHDNEMNHLITLKNRIEEHGKPGCKNLEPTYSEKLRMLRERGKWGEVAIEIMPPDNEIVDVEDVYHLWEFQYIYSFGWNMTPIFTNPPSYDQEYNGVRYHVEIINGAMYIYYQDRENMPWKMKQALKTHVATPMSQGVEFVCEAMESTNHGCIMVLPLFEYLDFGLERPSY